MLTICFTKWQAKGICMPWVTAKVSAVYLKIKFQYKKNPLLIQYLPSYQKHFAFDIISIFAISFGFVRFHSLLHPVLLNDLVISPRVRLLRLPFQYNLEPQFPWLEIWWIKSFPLSYSWSLLFYQEWTWVLPEFFITQTSEMQELLRC